jgi:hypothetical protein
VTQLKYRAAAAILSLAVFSTQTMGQPSHRSARSFIVCDPPELDPCKGGTSCVTISDETDVAVEPNGQIYLNGENINHNQLKEYAAAWAKKGTWPIVVSGRADTKYAQITSVVAMLRKAGVKTRVSCLAPQP